MPLSLAVIGAGVMGCSHIERIRISADCVLAAVCDISECACAQRSRWRTCSRG